MKTKQLTSYLFASTLLMSTPAYAYLDPGTGSLLFSALLTLISTLYFWGKSVLHWLASKVMTIGGYSFTKSEKQDVVIYSEGGQYWNTFRTIVESLCAQGISVKYLTSHESDLGLQYDETNYSAEFIGTGYKAYAYLNFVSAKVCLMTTPGLDVLQIKKSNKIDHYSHVVHAPTTGTYKLFSFDYFDSVLCSGQHQIDAISELENLRGTRNKTLFKTGCTYMDVLERKKHDQESLETKSRDTILLAPSWGKNGLLSKFGSKIIDQTRMEGSDLIIRPHPQSLVVEKELINELMAKYPEGDSVHWDLSSDAFDSLSKASILISDFSGIVFDFSLAFLKPVITLDFEVDLTGLDANDLKDGLWELNVLNIVGRKVNANDLDSLKKIIKDLVSDASFADRMLTLRQNNVFNYGQSGRVAAKQIAEVLKGLGNTETQASV